MKLRLAASEETCKLREEEISLLKKKLSDTEAELHKSEVLRKKLHNTILELKGKIRVFCRVRPLFGRQVVSCISCPTGVDNSLTISGEHSFTFDKVFGPGASQEEVFIEVSQLVQSALDGYKVCIFAYGQTGSEKTYTMMGSPEPPLQTGVIPRSLEQVFNTSQDLIAQGWEYNMKVSVLEIYIEEIRDLLCPVRGDVSRAGKKCTIMHDVDGNTHVSHLIIVDVHSSGQVFDLRGCRVGVMKCQKGCCFSFFGILA